MNYAAVVFGSSPGDFGSKVLLAFFRSLRTFLQGFAAALVSAFPGQTFFDVSYWKAFAFSILAAAITAVASFIQNVATVLPEDPTQKDPKK